MLTREYVREPALQPAHDLLETAQGDALFASFETIERGWREAEPFGKLCEG